MSGHRGFVLLSAEISPARRARIEQKKNEIRLEMALHELGEVRQPTQIPLGNTPKVDKP